MHEIKRTDGRYAFNAAAALAPGELVLRPDGTPAILDGLESVAVGQLIEPEPLVPTNIVDFDSASATVFAAGAVVYHDAAAKQAVTLATGNTRVGIAARAKSAGQLKVLVNCTPV